VPAFVFPGQGSQRAAMGVPWRDHPSWEVVDDASAVAGIDLAHLLLRADGEELAETRNAQLATFTMSLVVLDAVERLGIEPTACAGHSLGEYTALVAAGAVGFEDGVRLVVERASAMEAASDDDPGLMLLIGGLDDEQVRVACRRADGDVWVANFNTPTEAVIAGRPEAARRAADIARQLGAAYVSDVAAAAAFHTPLMATAQGRLRKALDHVVFHEPAVPVVANVDGMVHLEAADWPLLLSAQMRSPVRWRQGVLRLVSDPWVDDGLVCEVGPGGVLSAMIRATAPGIDTLVLAEPDDLDRLVGALAGDTPLQSFTTHHQGEHLYVSERLVISPAAGIFQPATDSPAIEGPLEVGTLLGTVGTTEVRSPFAGQLMGVLTHPGERVQTGQPIAWLRAGDSVLTATTERRSIA
jgi:[acyl-carrier-protein] S-malonyltransferase